MHVKVGILGSKKTAFQPGMSSNQKLLKYLQMIKNKIEAILAYISKHLRSCRGLLKTFSSDSMRYIIFEYIK